MVINHQRRFIFFHVPKAAGSSIRAALLRAPGSEDVSKPTKHLTPAEIDMASDARASYFSFCFVRDPWERFGSLHRFLAVRDRTTPQLPADLNAFAAALVERAPWLMQMRSVLPQCRFAQQLSFIGRFEQLEQDFAHVAQLIGLPYAELKHKLASGQPTHYRDRMTARTDAIIADFYREDIERFGYH